MKLALAIAAGTLLAQPSPGLLAGTNRVLLPRRQEAFLVEDDLVYARCLDLLRDGTYRQINRDEHGSEEVDRGTWDQSTEGALRLRASRHALRYHGLVAGPLSLALGGQAQRDALPSLLDSTREFLAASADAVFSARDVAAIRSRGVEGLAPFGIAVAPQAETCSRRDLDALARSGADFVRTEQSGVYVLTPAKTAAGHLLFVLADATFQAADVSRVRREYGIRPSERPPFYFVLVDGRTFARETGSWRLPRLPGSPE